MRIPVSAKRYGYWVYRHLAPKPLFSLQDAQIYANAYDPALVDVFTSLVTDPSPRFIGRIGGSDYEIVAKYFNDRNAFADDAKYRAAVERLQQLNGYFDFDHDYANFIRFLDDMISYYKSADCLLYCSENLITKFQHNVFQSKDLRLLKEICRGKTLVNYTFVEAVMPFLESFKTWGTGKKILIVSPFSKSLEFQYQRLNELLVNFEFPEFELITYTAPVTYCVTDDTKETLNVTTSNWHEQCQKMAEEISSLDFDIAFLSCASYSMYLGDFIRQTMGRTSIYTGGILNVLFNIYGERYDTPFFNSFMRPDTQIDAFENEDIASLRGGRCFGSEALKAYFGERTP